MTNKGINQTTRSVLRSRGKEQQECQKQLSNVKTVDFRRK